VVAGGAQVGVDAQRFVRSLKPPANVTFLGEVEEPRLLELYARCRGFIATARDEDFGLTPVEAMASGKAVVAVDEGGYRESVVPGLTGWLVRADPEALTDAIVRATPAVLERMSSACRTRSLDFDTAAFLARMRSLVEQAAAGRRANLTEGQK
jgi:glycosyltransferase involved in cell wall biosynthesis